MKKIGQYLLGFLFLLMIVELVLISPAEISEKKPSEADTSPKITATQDVEQLMEGIHFIETKNEEKEWELWAQSAIGFKKRADLALKKVTALFYADEGMTFNVKGEEGEVHTDSKNMVVGGGVVTQSSNGYTFKTARVEYNSTGRFLNSPQSVEVTGPKDGSGSSLFLRGAKMSADLNKGSVLIESDVLARKTMSPDKKLAVTSQKALLSGSDKSVRFSGKVVIDMYGMKITGPDALFKYSDKSNLLETIELEGGVRVSDLSKWATSEKLVINMAKNEFVFDGRPRVVQDNDELRGDQIVFLNGGKKVQVRNAKIKVSRDSINQSVDTKRNQGQQP